MGDHELHPTDEAAAERGRAIVQAAVAQTRAPLALRERIEADRTARRPARRRWALGGSLATGAIAAIVAVVLAVGGGGHTCVLSGPASVPSERLLALASWSGTEVS